MTRFKFKFERPCSHKVSNAGQALPDCHPLTRTEVRDLLNFAMEAGQAAAAVHVRLGQAIPGTTCPRPDSDSTVGRKHTALNDAFVNGHGGYRTGGTPERVAAIAAILGI